MEGCDDNLVDREARENIGALSERLREIEKLISPGARTFIAYPRHPSEIDQETAVERNGITCLSSRRRLHAQ
jgi:hypothetical protein